MACGVQVYFRKIAATACAKDVRAVPVWSRAIAVCVCVDRLIYRYITVYHCTLIPVRTSARLGGALP